MYVCKSLLFSRKKRLNLSISISFSTLPPATNLPEGLSSKLPIYNPLGEVHASLRSILSCGCASDGSSSTTSSARRPTGLGGSTSAPTTTGALNERRLAIVDRDRQSNVIRTTRGILGCLARNMRAFVVVRASIPRNGTPVVIGMVRVAIITRGRSLVRTVEGLVKSR